jgi:hypothetical protein
MWSYTGGTGNDYINPVHCKRQPAAKGTTTREDFVLNIAAAQGNEIAPPNR